MGEAVQQLGVFYCTQLWVIKICVIYDDDPTFS